MQIICKESGLFGLAGPGTSPCSTRGPQSANINAHFDTPPVHAVLKIGGGSSQTLLPILERRPWLHPIRFRGRGWFPPSLHLSPASFPAGRGLLHALSGQERFLHRHRSRSPPPQGGQRGGSALSSAAQLYQLHLSCPKEKWRDASDSQPEKVERGAPQHPILPDGDSGRRPPRRQTYATPTSMFPSTPPRRNR
jgi:hypothetical protein